MTDRRFEVTYSTMGEQNPSQLTLSKPYRWRGHQDWEPGHPAYREREAGPNGGGAAMTERREQRVREFAAILRSLGADDPAYAPADLVAQAAGRMRVSRKTAVGYRTDLRRQQREEAQR